MVGFLGAIEGFVQVRPEVINFGSIGAARLNAQADRKNHNQRSVTVMLRQGDDLKIKKIKIDQAFFDTQVKEIEAGKRYQIDVTLHPEKIPQGTVNERMKLYTNQRDEPVKVIPIRLQNIARRRPEHHTGEIK
jgi:hypothetical protein